MLADFFSRVVHIIHFKCDMDGIYADGANGASRFRWVKAPTSEELTQLAHTIAQRIGRFLERQGLLERDAENSYLAKVKWYLG